MIYVGQVRIVVNSGELIKMVGKIGNQWKYKRLRKVKLYDAPEGLILELSRELTPLEQVLL